MEDEARRAEDTANSMSEPTDEERMELQFLLSRFPQLDAKALTALAILAPREAAKALRELEAKGGGIRNPSAWICRTVQNIREKQKHPAPPPPREEETNPGQQLGVVDYYAALEVPEDADETTIKKAYRKLVLKWHPDKHPEDRVVAEEKIRAVNGAYETLSNPTKRSTYDAQRQALERRRRGFGPDTATAMAPRQCIPREFMLQPIGYADKFVRYSTEQARSQCFVNSRDDARSEGKSGLEQFVPFFKAAKMSLWWLPEVNNMCRIRALEARTRSSAGEKVVAGRPGGLNMGFRISIEGQGSTDSDVILMEAGKGEKNEMVNFIVVPSPLYNGAFRFEGAFRRGYFLAFRPSTQLRMVPHSGGAVPTNVVIDFTLVDFQAMFKFIDIEEVLRPVLETRTGWVPLEQLRGDPNVIAYFANILQKPMWDDEDFATYFEGHFQTWEFRRGCHGNVDSFCVRLRSVDERLGFSLERARSADDAASLINTAGDDLRRLACKSFATAFEALGTRPGSEDVAAVVQRMEAHRRLFGALHGVLTTVSEEASFTELANLAEALRTAGGEGAAPDMALRSTDACAGLAKAVLARIGSADRTGSSAAVSLSDVGSLLALPGVAACGDSFARRLDPPLSDAPLASLLAAVATAQSVGAASFAAAAADAVFRQVIGPSVTPTEAAGALRALAASGMALDRCASVLERRSSAMEVGELATVIAVLGEKGHESADLARSCSELASRGPSLVRLPAVGLLALAVAATKTASMGPCIGRVIDTAVTTLGSWATADAVRFILAGTKAKGNGAISLGTRAALMRSAAATIAPHLAELPAAELVRLALAAGPASATSGTSGLGAATNDAGTLLEAVATEAARRLSDLPQAHLLLLTQGLAPLGGAHAIIRQICSFWGQVLQVGEEGPTDDVTRRRKDLEKGQVLTADQVAKLAAVLEPLGPELDGETANCCFAGLGARLAAGATVLSVANRDMLIEQVRKGQGVGRWDPGRERLLRSLERAAEPPRARSSSSSRSCRSSGRRRSRSTSDRSRGGRHSRRRGRCGSRSRTTRNRKAESSGSRSRSGSSPSSGGRRRKGRGR